MSATQEYQWVRATQGYHDTRSERPVSLHVPSGWDAAVAGRVSLRGPGSVSGSGSVLRRPGRSLGRPRRTLVGPEEEVAAAAAGSRVALVELSAGVGTLLSDG